MSQFEDDLRAALRREEPRPDFAARVAARTPRPRNTGWIAAAVAAGLLASAGGIGYRQYEGRKAKRELLIALEITGAKLRIAQQKVSDLNRKTIHE